MFLAVWQRLALTVNAAKYAPLFDYASTFTTAAATSMTLHDVYFDVRWLAARRMALVSLTMQYLFPPRHAGVLCQQPAGD